MKALFIWNSQTTKFIKDHIQKVKQFDKGTDCTFITNEVDFKNMLDNWDSEFTKIYILAELNWNENDLFGGYQKGFEILEIWGSRKAPSLEFFSIANRNLIYRNVVDKLKFIVKAFTFTDFFQIRDKYKFNTENINQYKWNSFQYMALTSYGVLDTLSHRLDSINDSNIDFKTKLSQLISELSSYKEFIGETIFEFIKNIEFTNNYIFELKLLIDKRIVETRGDKVEKINLPVSIKILLIEDNKEDLKLIEQSLSRYSNYIKTTSSGEEAIKLLLDTDTVFDFVISDLELLDLDGFYQKVQGVEIFESTKIVEGTVVGIITGLGRKGVAKLLNIDPNLILPKKNLHRFDADEELDTLLKNLLTEFIKKEDQLKIEYGPSKGTYFSLPGFKTSLARAFSNEEFKKETWTQAFNILDRFKNKSLLSAEWDKSLTSEEDKDSLNADDFIVTKLNSLLAQRLILIFLGLKNNGVILPNDLEEEYFEILSNNKLSINKGYINRIALVYNTVGLRETFKDEKGKIKEIFKGFRLESKALLPEELAFIRKYEKESEISNFQILIKDNSPITLTWVLKYFDFEYEWYKNFDVPDNVKYWQFEHLDKVCNAMFSDFRNNPSTSIYKETLESLIESLTRSIENELFPVLPDLELNFNNIGDILVNLE